MAREKVDVEDIADGLSRLIREVRVLQREVAGLNAGFRGLETEKKVHLGSFKTVPPEWQSSQSLNESETGRPKSVIAAVRREIVDQVDQSVTAKLMAAIAKEIDGSLRDIHAARRTLKVIEGSDDLTDAWREWQEKQISDS